MQSDCTDEFQGEMALDPSTQEILIQYIFGGHLKSQVEHVIFHKGFHIKILISNC